MMIERVWLGEPASHEENLAKALKWLSSATNTGETALLLVAQVSNAEPHTIIGGTLGEEASKALKAGHALGFGSGLLQLATLRRTPSGWRGGPVLAAWANQELLDHADALRGVTGIVAVGWGENDELANWIKTWNVPKLGATVESARPIVSNYVVENALRDVVGSVNIADGGTHASDHAAIVHMFRTLRENGVEFNPDEVRSWVIAELGMHPRHAEKIRGIAAAIRSGRRVVVRDRLPRNDSIIESWRKKQ